MTTPRTPSLPANSAIRLVAGLLSILLLGACAATDEAVQGPGEGMVPITTSSEEARQAFLTGRHLAESLRATDARPYFQTAVELDPNFALAHLALASTAPTAQEFFDSLNTAVELTADVSPGERLMIEATQAGVKGDPQSQRQLLDQLFEIHPDDERVQNLIANFHFGRQEWQVAIRHYVRATELNPDFAPPYNNLGYAQRFLDRYGDAEKTFKKYIALLPEEPNPYDSYGELLMKMGRFEDSIAQYEMALERDPNFVPSYTGIGMNQIFLGDTEAARDTFHRLHEQARSAGEKRQAVFLNLISRIYDGDHAAALERAEDLFALAEEIDDRPTMAGDLNLMADILLDAGATEEAAERYDESVRAMELAQVLDEVKENGRRNNLFDQARVALAAGDIETANRFTEDYGAAVAGPGIPFEIRRHHELLGRLALDQGDAEATLEHLEQANQQDPRVLYLMALASRQLEDLNRAKELAYRSARWHGLGINYAYIQERAQKLSDELEGD